MHELKFSDCIQDSPAFREALHKAEIDAATLEHYLDKLVKHSNVMIETGKNYNAANKYFLESMDELASYSQDDRLISEPLTRFGKTWAEMISCHNILVDQTQRSVKSQLSSFIRDDIKATKDLKKSFDKVTEDYYNALTRHAGANKNRQHDVEDAEMHLASNKVLFHKTGMDYVFQLNALHGQKKFQIVDKLLSFMHAVYTYFHQGYELFKDLEPYIKRVATELDHVRKETEKREVDMKIQQERHQMIGDNSMFITQDKFDKNAIVIEGHLFKRASNAFKTWNRRWFVVKQNKLCYMKKHNESTIIVDDLRLCTVRQSDDLERRFCFEVILPGKLVVLQADSEDMRQAWLQAIQTSINSAFKETLNPTSSSEQDKSVEESTISNTKVSGPPVASTEAPKVKSSGSVSSSKGFSSPNRASLSKPSFLENQMSNVLHLTEVPGNKFCADCKKSEPRWASVNLGILLCIECSGVHRSLGVQVSKVRSLTLDSWDPDVIQIMTQLGNKRVNEIYEGMKPSNEGIKPGCLSKDRHEFIKAKYVSKKFMKPLPSKNSVNDDQLFKRWTIRREKSKNSKTQNKDITKTSASNIIPQSSVQSHDGSVPHSSLFAADEINSLFYYFDKQNEETESHARATELPKDVAVFGVTTIPDADSEIELEDTDFEDIDNLDPNFLLYKSSRLGYLPVMILARASGANINWHNMKEDGKTPLMQATTIGSIPACEYLLLNGAKINEVDVNNRTALHYAVLCNNTGIACQFLKRKVNTEIVDAFGKTALQIAVDSANADIVTLIRLKKMNDEMKDSDPSSSQTDSLVTDVFRDFSHRAATSDLPSPNPLPPSSSWLTFNNVAMEDPPPDIPKSVDSTRDSKSNVATGMLIDFTDSSTANNMKDSDIPPSKQNTNNSNNKSEEIENPNHDMHLLNCESSV